MSMLKSPSIKGVDPTEAGFDSSTPMKEITGHLFNQKEGQSVFTRGVVIEVISDPETLYKLLEVVVAMDANT